jgi:hypothetical protein
MFSNDKCLEHKMYNLYLFLILAHDFEEVKREVQELLEGNIIIGQSPGFDFNVSYFFFNLFFSLRLLTFYYFL